MVVSDIGKIAKSQADQLGRWAVGATAVAAFVIGTLLGSRQNLTLYLALGGAAVMISLFLAWQDDLLGAMAVATVIFVDYYDPVQLPVLHIPFPAVATTVIGVTVYTRFLLQSRAHPWVRTPYIWTWALVLLLAMVVIPASESKNNAVRYFVTVLVNMALAYVLGTQIGRGVGWLRRLLIALAVLASLIAIHAIFEELTGTFLFVTPAQASFLAVKSNYALAGSGKIRAGSFLINPDNLGTYLDVMLPILVGLGIALTSLRARIAAFVGAALVALALLFTYSTASWVGTAVAFFAAFLFLARGWVRVYLPAIVVVVVGVLGVVFPDSVQALLAHAAGQGELSLRIGAWETGLNIIVHNPLTGIGLGYFNYLDRAGPYRVPLQTEALVHPHNSFLELAAMAGIPVALFYMLVLGLCLVAAWRNYLRARKNDRILIGAVLMGLLALTVNSLATPGWTFPPVGLVAWLLLGAVASPALVPAAAEATPSTDRPQLHVPPRLTAKPAAVLVEGE